VAGKVAKEKEVEVLYDEGITQFLGAKDAAVGLLKRSWHANKGDGGGGNFSPGRK